MGLFDTLNRLGILSVGRRPEWRRPASTTGAPTSPADGVSIAGAVKTLVSVALREEVHHHTARVQLGFEAGTTYRVTVAGHAVDVAADTDEATTLDALATAINTDPNASLVAVAAVEDATLVLRGLAGEDYDVDTAVVSGTGTITHTADATHATARVYLLAGGIGAAKPAAWCLARNGEFELDWRGLTERLDTAGYDRCHVEVEADGTFTVAVGPGVSE